jgi:hypothetical protein
MFIGLVARENFPLITTGRENEIKINSLSDSYLSGFAWLWRGGQ